MTEAETQTRRDEGAGPAQGTWEAGMSCRGGSCRGRNRPSLPGVWSSVQAAPADYPKDNGGSRAESRRTCEVCVVGTWSALAHSSSFSSCLKVFIIKCSCKTEKMLEKQNSVSLDPTPFNEI